MVKKRGIAKKPTSADQWVDAGGTDPELNQPSAQTSKRPSSPLAKSKDPTYTRCTLYLPEALHTRMKHAATDDKIELSDIAELAIAEWLDKRSDV